MFRLNLAEDGIAQRFVADQRGVQFGNPHVGLRHV